VDWRVKGLIQKGLSLVPGGVRLNSRLQHVVGGMRDFDVHLAGKIGDWTTSMGYLSDVDFHVSEARLMEIGTGWHPTLPLCFVLAGARSVATFDIVRLLDETVTFRLLDSLEEHVPKIADLAGENSATVHARLLEYRRSKNLGELLSKSCIEYFAPADGRATGLEPNSIDLVYSNSVLEHVPREVIRSLMEESFRVLKPGGLAMHNVGCNDHYAFFDKSISFVNFLQYGEREWRLWNNPIQYQNRLRAPEFVELAIQAGFDVIHKRTHVRPGTLEALASLRIAPQFDRFSIDEIAATTVDFIGRKPAR
jgi:SAM-dependent methyltransferase